MGKPDIVKRLEELSPSKLETGLFTQSFALSPIHARALLRAGSRHEREMIIAAALTDNIKALKEDRSALDNMI